jgi:serine/threonine protein kinase
MQICLNCLDVYEEGIKVCPHCGFGSWRYRPDDFCLDMGVMLKGRYKVGTVIGAGGFGITYRAVDIHTGSPIAIKEFYPNGMVSRKNDHITVQLSVTGKEQVFAKGMHNFLEEAKGLARFRGVKSIVQVYDYFEQNGTAYIVMEYLRGKSLSAYAADNGGRISYSKALNVMLDIIAALEVVHASGMVHRDISPDNVFMMDNGQVKLIDFGAARESYGYEDKTISIVLKPSYAPPEQFKKKSRQGPWTDIYALGATIYKVVTGVLPPESVSRYMEDELLPPSVYTPGIPIYFDNIIMKAMALGIEDRFQNVNELRQAILSIQRQPQGGGGRNAGTAPAKKKSGNGAALGLLFGAVGVTLIVLLILIIAVVVPSVKNKKTDDSQTDTATQAYNDSTSEDTENTGEEADDDGFVDYGYFIYESNSIIYPTDYIFDYSPNEITEDSTLNYTTLDTNEIYTNISYGIFDQLDIEGEDYENGKVQAMMLYGDEYTDNDLTSVLKDLENVYGMYNSSGTDRYIWKQDTMCIYFTFNDDGVYIIYMTPDYYDANTN